MSEITQRDIDKMSDALKAAAIRDYLNHINTEKAAAYFANMPHGVELRSDFGFKPDGIWQPLFYTAAHPNQEPVAWEGAGVLTRKLEGYDCSLKWRPLYTARP